MAYPTSTLAARYARRLHHEFPSLVLVSGVERCGAGYLLMVATARGATVWSSISHARHYLAQEQLDVRAARRIHVGRIGDGPRFFITIDGGERVADAPDYFAAMAVAEQLERDGAGHLIA